MLGEDLIGCHVSCHQVLWEVLLFLLEPQTQFTGPKEPPSAVTGSTNSLGTTVALLALTPQKE